MGWGVSGVSPEPGDRRLWGSTNPPVRAAGRAAEIAMQITVVADNQARLAAGLEPAAGGRVVVHVDPAEVPEDLRPLLVEAYEAGGHVPWGAAVRGTPGEIVELLRAEASRRAAASQRLREAAKLLRDWADRPVDQWPVRLETGEVNEYGVRYTRPKWSLDWAAIPSAYPGGYVDRLPPRSAPGVREALEEFAAAAAAFRQARDAVEAELRQRTEAARQAARAAVADQIAAVRAEQARREEEERARAAAGLAAKLADRAARGGVTIQISRGDPREWGTPWGAVVRPGKGRQQYDFSAASYDAASETLFIRCAPGDVIAWGQKNYRRPKRTLHEVRRVTEDWRLVSV